MRQCNVALMVLSALLVLSLAACTDDPLAQQYREGTEKGYVAGYGNVITTPPAERGDPIAFDAKLSDGTSISLDTYAGRVVVVNFWWALCVVIRSGLGQNRTCLTRYWANYSNSLLVMLRLWHPDGAYHRAATASGTAGRIDPTEATAARTLRGRSSTRRMP